MTHIIKHIGSAKSAEEIEILRAQAERHIVESNPQLSLFEEPVRQIVTFDAIEAIEVSHEFARDVLLSVADQCGLGSLDVLFQDLAVMRIIEPSSKKRSLELIQQYFGVTYSLYVYERLPALLEQGPLIEQAAVRTARIFSDFAFLLYDVTTLYFETHKPNDELQARGFSKDDKSKQPQIVIGQNEPGRRAKFVKKTSDSKRLYACDEALKEKTQLLLGIKGYCTNIPEEQLSNEKIIHYYHELWHVEQAFRMSKSDLKARPIFHHSHEAIRAHALICFMGLMIEKFIEIKAGMSLRSFRDLLWQAHEIHLLDPKTGRQRIVRTQIKPELKNALVSLEIKNTH